MTPSGLHSHLGWNWRAHGFGSPAVACGAILIITTFLQLQKATLGTSSRLRKNPGQPSLSWGSELTGARFWRPGCCIWSYFLTASESNVRHRQPSVERPRPAFPFMGAFGATFLQLQKATLGTGSRLWNDPARLSCSWGLELAGTRFWRPGCCIWSYFLTASESNVRPRQQSVERPRPAIALMGFGTGGRTVLEARLLHLELLSYSFRKRR